MRLLRAGLTGPKPPVYLQPGKTLRVGASGLGEQCATTMAA